MMDDGREAGLKKGARKGVVPELFKGWDPLL